MVDAGAMSIIIDAEYYDSLSYTNKANLEVHVPVSVAGIEEGGTASVEHSGSATSKTLLKASLTRKELFFKPHFKGDAVLYNAGEQYKCVNAVVRNVVVGDRNKTEMKLSFTTEKTEDQSIIALFDAAKVVGVGRELTGKAKEDWSITIDVIFFEQEVFDKAATWSRGAHGLRAAGARYSLSGLASVRAEFIEHAHAIREDYIVHMAEGEDVPLNEITKEQVISDVLGAGSVDGVLDALEDGHDEIAEANAASAAFALRQATEPIKTMVVPFTVYGPEGGGRTSTVFTWEESVRALPGDHIKNGAERFAAKSRQEDSYVSFLKGIKFDPNPNTGRNSTRLQAVRDEEYTELPKKSFARCVFYDTMPAVSSFKDADERPLPFGMLVLVLDYSKAVAAYEDASGHTADDGTIAWDDATTANAFQKEVEPLLGNEVVTEVAQKRGKLSRYPPIATVLAKCSSGQLRDVEMVDNVIAWCKTVFQLTNVYAMETFVPPNRDELAILEADEDRKCAYANAWGTKAVDALAVLSAIIDATAKHEQLAVWRLRKAYKVAETAKAAKAAAAETSE